MKISEIRNNLFGLSDLKGLIGENTFDEHRGSVNSIDWAGYFKEKPERLNLSLTAALGLSMTPKTPLTLDQLGDSEMRRYFGDEFVSKIISDPSNFVKDKGFSNAYKNARKNNREVSQVSKTGIEFLKQFFIDNGGEQIDNSPVLQLNRPENINQNNGTILNYFGKVKLLSDLAAKSAEENNIKKFDDSGLVIGKIDDPFSMFLYFFFRLHVSSSGSYKRTTNYDNNIPEEFKPYIERVLYDIKDIEGGALKNEIGNVSLQSLIQTNLLTPIGIKYNSELYEYSELLYNAYFKDSSGAKKLNSILSLIPAGSISIGKGYGKGELLKNTVGGVLYDCLAIIGYSDSSQNSIREKVKNYMDVPELRPFRSAAYLIRYENKTNQIIDDAFRKKMSVCFNVQFFNDLFDPVGTIDFTAIENGIKKWVEIDDISHLAKSVLSVTANDNQLCPAELIFKSAREINGLLKENYSKYGTGPGKALMTIETLLSDANEALNYWNSLNPTNKVPAAQDKLVALYKNREQQNISLSFWRLLAKDNQVKDATQTQIYLWLVDHTKPEIDWTYEFNRFETIDSELGGKSIDILGKTPGNTFCFEYQGEQHYRPLTVKYEEYSKFPLFTEMRDYILTECGFIQKTEGGTKFFSGPENSDAKRMYEIKSVILNAYRKFYTEILGKTNVEKLSSRGLQEGFVPAVNKKAVFKNDTELLAYFQTIINKTPNDSDIFDYPPIDGVIPYLGSPRRFLDEVKTAQDMGRDLTKRKIIRSRENAGWKMSYIIPGKATKDEQAYTEQELAGNNAQVFRWNKDGKNMLLMFLAANGLKNDVKTNVSENTLFKEIVEELNLVDFL